MSISACNGASTRPAITRLLSLAATIACATLALHAADEVKIDSGRLKGATRDGVTSFKGIPFAAPPVGNLRWRPPQPVKAWDGVRPATEYAADCMQNPFPGDAAPLGTPPAEDCLYANVWRPEAASSTPLPVMVWIYGGGFVNGGSSPAVYDGSQFAKRGVVFVSFNYRLGRFGFFAHPALTKEGASGPLGNYGYMDQIAALQWVKRNVAAFGGAANNVTVFGESAGGGSVIMLLTSPMAKGLFSKAIIESGGGRTLLMGARYLNRPGAGGLPSAESIGLAFAKSANIEGDDAAALAALRKLPADAVVAGLNMASMNTPTYGGPMIDGKVVTESPEEAYAAGRGAKVPLIAGANSSDIGFPRGRTKDELFAPFGDKDKAKAAFDPDGSGQVMAVGMKMGADQMMVEPARYMVRTLAAAGQPAYEYRFSYVIESMRKDWHGAPHATEIPFVFDTVEARYSKDLTPSAKAIAQAANAYWVNFAKTGNPNGKGLPEWPAYSPKTDMLMDFALTGPQGAADPWKQRLDLIEGLASSK
jgi:para-nitrobenzyl esterase